MHPLFAQFIEYLDKSDKEACVIQAVQALKEGRIDIVTLYTEGTNSGPHPASVFNHSEANQYLGRTCPYFDCPHDD